MNAEVKEAQSVVTSENLQDFQFKKLGIDPKVDEPKEEPKAESEEHTEEEAKEIEEFEKEPEEPKHEKPKTKLEKRFSELTKQREDARKEAQTAREAQQALEKRLAEIEGRLNPQEQPQQDDGKPDRAQFTDAFEYAEKLAEWSAKQALAKRDLEEAEKAAKQQQEQTVKSWQERLSKTKQVYEDFDEVVAESPVAVSDQVRDAILESDIGPELVYYFAKNPDVVEKISGMNVLQALKEVGRIEAKLEKPNDKPVEKPVQVSKAPPPISPIKGTASADNLFDSNGEFTGTPAQYRELRKAGKIK